MSSGRSRSRGGTAGGLEPADTRRILLIRLAALGDVLLTTPVVRLLRESFPDCHLSYLTASPAATELLRSDPSLDTCILSDGRIHEEITRLAPFDLALDLFGSPASQLITVLSGAKCRVGTGPAPAIGGIRPYTVTPPAGVRPANILAHFASFTSAIGLPPPSPRTSLFLGEDERESAESFLTSCGIRRDDPWIAMQPGSRKSDPHWSPSLFSAAGRELARLHSSPILVFQGPDDRTLAAEQVQREIGPSAVIVPVQPVRCYAALLENALLLVTPDGGASHVAGALGVPAVVLFGGAASYWFPYGEEAGMIAVERPPGRELTAEDVIRAAASALRASARRSGRPGQPRKGRTRA
jgi:ADP-heptose:LPS heptosyltransferase